MDVNTVRPWPQQWLHNPALKIGTREVPGSIPGRAYRPSRSEFSVVFTETRVNTGNNSLKRFPTKGIPPIDLGPSLDNWP